MLTWLARGLGPAPDAGAKFLDDFLRRFSRSLVLGYVK
jgi:hypothetical protein